mgnify:CR=1 FL=1
MKILQFAETYWSDILLIISLLAVIIRSIFTNKLDYLKADIFSLVTDAENLYGEKSGEMKLAFVVKKVYSKMPLILKTFLTEKRLEKIIETVLLKAKNAWEKQLAKTEE